MIEKKRLDEIAEIIMGQSPPGETYNKVCDGLPFFQGKAEFGDEYPTPVKWCPVPTRIAEPGDILLSVRAPVGPSNTARERCGIGRGLAAIRAKQGVASTRYLRYFFRRFEPDVAQKGVGSTFFAINRDDIVRLNIPLPSLPEQQRIVRILDEADALRQLCARADTRTNDFIPALFNEMFGDPATNPKGWHKAKFGDVCDCRLGKMLDAKKQTGKHARPYLRNVNVQWGRFDLSDVFEMDFNEKDREEFRLKPGDVLICEGGEVGRSAIWNDELPECYFQKALHRARPEPTLAVPELILWLMWALAHSGGLGDFTTQATIAHLTGVKLKSLAIPLPPIALQREFAARVAEVRALQTQQARSRRRLEDLFQALLHRAFAGEL